MSEFVGESWAMYNRAIDDIKSKYGELYFIEGE